MKLWTWADYEKHVRGHIGTFGEEMVQRALRYYPNNTVTPEYQYTSLGADIRVNCPNDIMSLSAAVSSESPIYRYVVTSTPSSPVHVLGAPFPSSYSFHMWDLYAYFGSIKDYIKPPAQSDMLFQANMRREVLSFIHNGKPFSKTWTPFPQSTALLSGSTITMTTEYHREQCNLWNTNGFFNYAWIN